MRSVVDLSTGVVSNTSVVSNAIGLTRNKILLSAYISCYNFYQLTLTSTAYTKTNKQYIKHIQTDVVCLAMALKLTNKLQ